MAGISDLIGTATKALDPYRWIAAGVGALALAAAVYWAYDWAYDRGYAAREREQQQAEADQRTKNAAFDVERIREGGAQARKYDNLIDQNNRKAADEKARLRARPAVAAAAGGLCPPNAAGMPGVPAAGPGADACAGVSEALIDANRIATNNADQVTALQAHIESSRRGYNTTTSQPDTRPASDAEARWAARLKALEDRANTLSTKR